MSELFDRLTAQFPGKGKVSWIGVRPDRKLPVEAVSQSVINFSGLSLDRHGSPGKRSVTLIQSEHLPVIANLVGLEEIDPAILRRNIAVSGINLLALRKESFGIGSAVLRGTGLCAPCSRMEEALGPGGFNALRGHGGITAQVLVPGQITIGDAAIAKPGYNTENGGRVQ
jgi:MOSC domain-containing protein YiiM